MKLKIGGRRVGAIRIICEETDCAVAAMTQ
jgi:hypothetical protein